MSLKYQTTLNYTVAEFVGVFLTIFNDIVQILAFLSFVVQVALNHVKL